MVILNAAKEALSLIAVSEEGEGKKKAALQLCGKRAAGNK